MPFEGLHSDCPGCQSPATHYVAVDVQELEAVRVDFYCAAHAPAGAVEIHTSADPVIAEIDFTDRTRRAVYLEPTGRQYVLGDDGQREYGTWVNLDPVIVEAP